MTDIQHHISEPLLAAYAAGNLSKPFELVVAAHVSMCDTCRASLSAHESAGGVVMDATSAPVSDDLKARVFDGLDADFLAPAPPKRQGIYPGPIAELLGTKPPKWSSLGLGVKQSILHDDDHGSARLLLIPPGQAVPDHGHNGLELTMVLQGAFHDETGHFGVGDVETADHDLEHTPIADDGLPCICLAATDAPLRFNSMIPRLLQPFFRI
ncbi:ChrR family anti-sigma-E factor [Aliiroseovarius sp. PTFE2010]|uniref:ChrR family anti-sigma-E factor n=1 Tax=Aliiroseovarius sp. PTFE2010 TaxID=3417190 RepID=UPI003CF1317C